MHRDMNQFDLDKSMRCKNKKGVRHGLKQLVADLIILQNIDLIILQNKEGNKLNYAKRNVKIITSFPFIIKYNL